MTLASRNTSEFLDQSQITSLQDFFEPYELLELERYFRSFDKDGSGELYLADGSYLMTRGLGLFQLESLGDLSWCNKTDDVSTAFMKWKFQICFHDFVFTSLSICKCCYSHPITSPILMA